MAKKPATKVVKKSPKKPAMKKAAPKKVAAKKSAPKKVVAKKTAAKKIETKIQPKLQQKAQLKAQPKVDLTKFLTPLDDRLIVQLTERETKTAGGLYIPDTVSTVTGNLEGHVIAIGRGHRDKKGRIRPLDVSVGDRILFPQYSGSKIDIQGADVVILRESDVMGLFQK